MPDTHYSSPIAFFKSALAFQKAVRASPTSSTLPDKGETLAGPAQPFGPTPAFAEFLMPTEKGIADGFTQDLTHEEHQLLFATQAATQGVILGTKMSQLSSSIQNLQLLPLHQTDITEREPLSIASKFSG
jgi:hypothetical protein